MVPSLLKKLLINSGDIVVNPFDNPLVSETVIFVILHVDDQMLMYMNADNVCRLDDFSRNLQIIGGRRKVIRRMVVAQNHCR